MYYCDLCGGPAIFRTQFSGVMVKTCVRCNRAVEYCNCERKRERRF